MKLTGVPLTSPGDQADSELAQTGRLSEADVADEGRRNSRERPTGPQQSNRRNVCKESAREKRIDAEVGEGEKGGDEEMEGRAGIGCWEEGV